MNLRYIKKLFFALLVLVILLCVAFYTLRYLYPQKYSDKVDMYSEKYGIESSMVYAIIKCESNFNENAISHANAYGLMQITRDTYEWAAKRENDKDYLENTLFDPDTNIRYGCVIYSIFKNEFASPSVCLAAYNAGRTRVKTWLGDKNYSADGKTLDKIPYAETENYVKKVLRTQKIYELIY